MGVLDTPGDALPRGVRRITRKHALSHADLHRVLPRLLEPASVDASTAGLLARFPDGRRLRIGFEPESESRIGALRVISSCFCLEFDGWSDLAIDHFLRRCERGLQQGGG